MEDTKKCTRCGRELPVDQFYGRKHKSGEIGYRSECKDCKRDLVLKYRNSNLDKVRNWRINWRRHNSEKSKAFSLKWRKANPDKERERQSRRYKNNPDSERERQYEWRKKKSEKWKSIQTKARRKRLAVDLEFRMICNLRAAMNQAFKNNFKSGHTVELLGCSIEELRGYLERLFLPGMSWENYGKNGWHIDHIIPLSYFDMSDPEQQKRAWHYTNLQPLWASDNHKKSNKIEEKQLVLL